MNEMPGTPSTPRPQRSKRELIKVLISTDLVWETIRVRQGKWYATARRRDEAGRPVRASATNERQAMENLCNRLGVL